ncbi:hypothetical protein NS44R_14770, partial [Mammaliicoccus sciuri]
LGTDQHHRHVERPQLDVTGRCDRDGAGGEDKHQPGPGIAGEGGVFRNGLGHDRRQITQHPAALQHDRADRDMADRGLGQHEARIVGE